MANQVITGATSFNILKFLATRTIQLASSGNFAVANSFLALGSLNTAIVFSATTSGQRGILRVTVAQSVQYVIATDIDSSVGTAVTDSAGTLSNTINWNLVAPDPQANAFAYFDEFYN